MINILGAASAYAKTLIEAELLAAADRSLSVSVAGELLKGRRLLSTLPADYIIQTGNSNLKDTLAALPTACTDLAYEASVQAINKAGLTVADIGLIIGDCATPFETIPTEAQRLGKRLGIKVPAYDINAGSLALFRHLEAIQNWRPEILPEHILCLSSNAPTQRVNFRNGSERFCFSDAAGAAVLSVRKSSKLACAAIKPIFMHDSFNTAEQSGISIGLHGYVNMDDKKLCEQHLSSFDCLSNYLKSRPPFSALHSPCCPQLEMLEKIGDNEIIQRLRLPEVNGYTLGTGAYCALAQACDTAENGATIGLFIANLETVNSEKLAGALITIESSR